MDTINVEAVNELRTTLVALLPPVADPALQPDLSVNPLRIKPSGLGRYVGPSAQPAGEILGVRVEARALVTVKANRNDDLGAPVAAVTRALVAADRGELVEQGILRIALDTIGPPVVREAGPPAAAQRRELAFNVLYEFLKPPEEAASTIRAIPLDIDPGLSGSTPQLLFAATFAAPLLDQFEVVDDPLATLNRPSSWQHNAAEQRIEQRSTIRGTSTAANPNKPGSYLVLRATPTRPPVRDAIVRATLQSGGDGGIGLVFGWRDVNNFFFFLMERQRNFRVLGKKVAGTFDNLAAPALDTAASYDAGRPYLVRITMSGPRITVFLDGEEVLAGADPALSAPGRVGLFSWRNDQAFFYGIDLLRI